MEISLRANHYCHEVIFKAENVNVVEDIEDRTYEINEDGKKDFSKPPIRDISDGAIEQIIRLLDDMTYYRKKEFDSSELIERLFEKLPKEVANSLLNKLTQDYKEELE